jgi:SAM-dependent methyltransferase
MDDAAFDQHAATYRQEVERVLAFSGRDHSFFLAAKVHHLLGLARSRCGDPGTLTGLDLGCGTGQITRLLAPHCRRLHGIDVTLAGLAVARHQVGTARLVAYDGHRMPFPDAAFDFAVAACVLHHVSVSARPALIAEVARVVRPGGMVAVYEHNPWNPLTRWVVARCAFDEDAVLLRCGILRRLLLEAGLERVEHAYILLSPWQGPTCRRAERALGWMPLGAQYCVAASRPL